MENLTYFHDLYTNISITLTKPTIEHLILNKDHIINNFEKIDINYYFPNKNYDIYLPSDLDFYNFLQWGIKNKKINIMYILNIIESAFNLLPERYCNCKTSLLYKNGKWTHNCIQKFSSIKQTQFYFEFNKYINQNNHLDIKNSIGVRKRGCLYCKYFNNCCMMCLEIILFKTYKLDQICPLQKIYNYILNNKQEYKNLL